MAKGDITQKGHGFEKKGSLKLSEKPHVWFYYSLAQVTIDTGITLLLSLLGN